MRILPTAARPDKIATSTWPAPPNKDGGETTFTTPRNYGGNKLKPRVQRTYWSGSKSNTLTAPPILLADWVIAEEVPALPISFLAYPTRRCFMEDWIQVRVQLGGMTMDAGATVEVAIERLGRLSDDRALFLSNDQARVNAVKKCWYKEYRPLMKSDDLSAETLADTSANIMYEVSATDANVSFVFTSVRIPAPPDDRRTEEEEYVFRAKVQLGGRTYETKSPVLRALRWWADPDKNLGQPKTYASTIEPLIDGEAYFARCAKMIEAAKQSICISNWKFYLDTFLTEEPGGVDENVLDEIEAGTETGKLLSRLLMEKAKAGVKIYLLLDSINGMAALREVNSALMKYNGAGNEENPADWTQILPPMLNSNIHIKLHEHPLKLAGSQLGSHHEKYMIVDEAKAVLGGIDFLPTRYQSQAHDWTSDWDAYDKLAKARILIDKGQVMSRGEAENGEDFRWHDAAVYAEGDLVPNIYHDFVRRWNAAGDDLGDYWAKLSAFTPINHLDQPKLKQTTDVTKHNTQVVKTGDYHMVGLACKQQGTFDAYKQAIREARHYIYIENQYFSWRDLGKELTAALAKNPGLQIMIVIPFETDDAIRVRNAGGGKERYKSKSTLGLLVDRMKDDVDESEMKNRGVQHLAYLQAQLINSLRAADGADDRVGFFSLAGMLKHHVTPRQEVYKFSGHDKEVIWRLLADDVVIDQGVADHRTRVKFTVPSGPKEVVLEGWDTGDAYVVEKLDVSGKGSPQTNTIVDDDVDGGPMSDIPWMLVAIEEGMTDGEVLRAWIVGGGVTQDDGAARFTIPVEATMAQLCWWKNKKCDWRRTYEAGDAQMIYTHSKLMIVDDVWAIVGSANANGRSLVTDEEINIVVHDRAVVTKLRKSLWKEHLGVDVETNAIRTFFKTWNSTAMDAVSSPDQCDPQQAKTVHAVKLGDPPAGQKYNGPLSRFIDMDKLV